MKLRLFFTVIMAQALSCVWGQQLTLTDGRTDYKPGETVTLSYEGARNGDVILLYHDHALLPLSERLAVKAESGTYQVVPSVLQPGTYHARLEGADGTVRCQTDFSVGTYDLPAGKRILVIADPHVMSPFLVEDPNNTRYKNVMAGERKLLAESYEIFQACMDSIRSIKPDLVIIPGDLTKDGEAMSHNTVASCLQELLDEGIPTLVIPGNHDLENHMGRRYTSEGVEEADFVMPDDFVELYRNFGWDERSDRDPHSLTYARDIFDGVRLIGIDDCRIPSRGDTGDNIGEFGRVPQATLDCVLAQTDQAVADGKVVIVTIHHQMLQHFYRQELLMASAATENGDSIARLLCDHGVRLVLTGHMHMPNISRIKGFETDDMLTEVSTASPICYPSQFRLLTISDDLQKVTVDTRNIRRIASADDLQLVARDKVGATLGKSMEKLVPRYMSAIESLVKELSSIPEFAHVVSDVPQDTDELAAIITEAFGETMRKVIFTASEGNEHLKDAANTILAQLEKDTSVACDLIFDQQNEPTKAFLAQSMYIYMLEMGEDIIKSMLSDVSYMGTDLADQTDDLYVTISLKDGESSITQMPAADKGVRQVYGLSGIRQPDGLSRLRKGIYVVREGGKSRKVVVR